MHVCCLGRAKPPRRRDLQRTVMSVRGTTMRWDHHLRSRSARATLRNDSEVHALSCSRNHPKCIARRKTEFIACGGRGREALSKTWMKTRTRRSHRSRSRLARARLLRDLARESFVTKATPKASGGHAQSHEALRM